MLELLNRRPAAAALVVVGIHAHIPPTLYSAYQSAAYQLSVTLKLITDPNSHQQLYLMNLSNLQEDREIIIIIIHQSTLAQPN